MEQRADWSNNVVPNGNFDVVVPAGNGGPFLDISVSINSLTLPPPASQVAQFEIGDGLLLDVSLTVNSAFTNTGALVINPGSSFNDSGTYTTTGVTYAYGTLSAIGGVIITNSGGPSRGVLYGGGTINATVVNVGGAFVLPPGAASSTTPVAGYFQGSGGTLEIGEIGTTFGAVAVTGGGANNVTLSGTFLLPNPGYAADAGTYTILSDPNGTISGNFTNFTFPVFSGVDYAESISADGHSVLLTVSGPNAPLPEPATSTMFALGLAVVWFFRHRSPGQASAISGLDRHRIILPCPLAEDRSPGSGRDIYMPVRTVTTPIPLFSRTKP